ncbi:MAG: hypothetical protein PWQ28_395 [Candidatus Woesearchaeota archaeon]|nr:hypothetical protein [Candidatus Woesearchaeota archaeon]
MNLKQTYEEIKESKSFKEFMLEHPKAFLNYVLYIEPDETLEYGTYDNETGKIGVFSKDSHRIEENALSKEEKKELAEDELLFNGILEKTSNIMQEKYNSEIIKKICLLAKNEEAEWRITFMLSNMKIIFVVTDLEGNIKKEEEIKLFSFN